MPGMMGPSMGSTAAASAARAESLKYSGGVPEQGYTSKPQERAASFKQRLADWMKKSKESGGNKFEGGIKMPQKASGRGRQFVAHGGPVPMGGSHTASVPFIENPGFSSSIQAGRRLGSEIL